MALPSGAGTPPPLEALSLPQPALPDAAHAAAPPCTRGRVAGNGPAARAHALRLIDGRPAAHLPLFRLMTPTLQTPAPTLPVLGTLLKVVSPYPHAIHLAPTFDSTAFYDIASRHYLCALVNARLGGAARQLPDAVQAKLSREQHVSAANTLF